MEIDLIQLEFIDSKLRLIAIETEEAFGCVFVVTSLYRIGDDGVHGQLPLRGLDWRCRNLAFGNIVAEHINQYWQYDYSRPDMLCCRCHAVEGGALHLHLQVHPKTKRRVDRGNSSAFGLDRRWY